MYFGGKVTKTGSVNNMNQHQQPFETETVTLLLRTFVSCHFSKRQANILAFMLALSLSTNRKYVHIPHLKDFKQCGVLPSKIRPELEKLVAVNVITWNEDQMIFSINTSISEWKVKRKESFSDDHCHQLIALNT